MSYQRAGGMRLLLTRRPHRPLPRPPSPPSSWDTQHRSAAVICIIWVTYFFCAPTSGRYCIRKQYYTIITAYATHLVFDVPNEVEDSVLHVIAQPREQRGTHERESTACEGPPLSPERAEATRRNHHNLSVCAIHPSIHPSIHPYIHPSIYIGGYLLSAISASSSNRKHRPGGSEENTRSKPSRRRTNKWWESLSAGRRRGGAVVIAHTPDRHHNGTVVRHIGRQRQTNIDQPPCVF